jgi:hypothetical protein
MNLDPAQILEAIDVLLRALGTKVLCIMALLMTFALYAWAMWKGNTLAFLTAAAFGIAVLLPVLLATFYVRGNDHGRTEP